MFATHPLYRGVAGFKVFTEFLGPHSFAGLHREGDPKELRLFDILAAGEGIISPERFVADFGHLPSARVVYEGKFTGKFADDVRRGRYNVAEGGSGESLWMARIKTDAYLARLKQAFAERWEDYWE